MLKFDCSECGKTISVPLEHAGKKGKCPGCKAVVRVPVVEPQLDSLRFDSGVMQLTAANDELMAAVAQAWPYPVRRVQFDQRTLGNVQFELPFRSADGSQFGAAMALQVALPPSRQETAIGVCTVNRILLAGGVAALHRAGLAGLVFPMSGLLQAPEGLVPTLALFVRAWAREGEALPHQGGFDDKLGPGTTRLFDVVMEGVRATASDAWPLLDVTDHAIASPLALALRWCDFFYLHGTVFTVKPRIGRDDPAWDVLHAGGVRRVVVMPMIDAWPRKAE